MYIYHTTWLNNSPNFEPVKEHDYPEDRRNPQRRYQHARPGKI